jgi:leader peptidase (prepilin peptidase)/N-methyltransferase
MINSVIELIINHDINLYIEKFSYIIIVLLFWISLMDIKYMIIPDILNITLALIGVIIAICSLNFIVDKVLGILIGFTIFMLIAIFTNAMGGGDIKLMSALGLIYGLKGVLFITLFSFVIGAIVSIILLSFKIKNKKDKIPFGPFISLAAVLYIFYGELIIKWYLGMFEIIL